MRPVLPDRLPDAEKTVGLRRLFEGWKDCRAETIFADLIVKWGFFRGGYPGKNLVFAELHKKMLEIL